MYLQGSNGETDIDNRLMVGHGERGGEGEMYEKSNMEIRLQYAIR